MSYSAILYLSYYTCHILNHRASIDRLTHNKMWNTVISGTKAKLLINQTTWESCVTVAL